MFFFLPIGHDQPVYERPWITIGIIVACVAAFVASTIVGKQAMDDLERAATHVDTVAREHPAARVSFTIEGLPPQLDAVIAPLIDSGRRTPQPGDAELEAAMLELVAAMNRMPMLRFGYRPGAPTWRGAFTHPFMHAGFFHLAGNMLFLWLSAGVLECFWRRWAFVLLYVSSAAAALLAHQLASPGSMIPIVGASGAIAGLMGAFLIGFARTRIKIFYFAWFLRVFSGTFSIPALIVIPLWAALQIFDAVLGSDDGVAYWAHVGGFVLGVLAAIVARYAKLVAIDDGKSSA